MSIEDDMADVEVDELLNQITYETVQKKVMLAGYEGGIQGLQPDGIIMGKIYYYALKRNWNHDMFLGFDIIEGEKAKTFEVFYRRGYARVE